jgi:LuxR family maltose regulon positive regulatory protein
MQAQKLRMLVRVGETEQVERALAEMDEEVRETSHMRVVLAALRLARDDPEAAVDVLAPVLDDSTPVGAPGWVIEALLLEAIARDALGDAGAAGRALERALDVAEPDGLLLPFLLHPAQELLERHARHRTTHASLISDILAARKPASTRDEVEPLSEPLSESEIRVLRYLPTNLSKQEIASELYLSPHTIKTHVNHLYTKLDVHSRAEAVERARALGLLAPSPRG